MKMNCRQVLLFTAHRALRTGRAPAPRQDRSRFPHQAPDRGGSGRSHTRSGHPVSRRGGRLRLRGESQLRRGAVEGESTLHFEFEAPQGEVGSEEAAHTPEEAAQRLEWSSPEDPGEWRAIIRRQPGRLGRQCGPTTFGLWRLLCQQRFYVLPKLV
jgi:hypothetical protein